MEPFKSSVDELRTYLRSETRQSFLVDKGADIRDIESLWVNSMNPEQALMIRDQCQSLKKLSVYQECNYEVAKVLNGCLGLKNLALNIDEDTLNSLSSFPQLNGLRIFKGQKQLEAQEDKIEYERNIFELLNLMSDLESFGELRFIDSSKILGLNCFQHLKDLKIRFHIPAEALGNLVSSVVGLRSLDLTDCWINNSHIRQICKHVQKLVSLNISNSPWVTHQGLNPLQQYLETMKRLVVNFTDDIKKDLLIEFLSKFSDLTDLRMEGSYIPQNLTQLSQLVPHLKVFAVSSISPNYKKVEIDKFLSRASNLESLSLRDIFSSNKIDLVSKWIFDKAPSLKFLTLDDSKQAMTHCACCYISKLKDLKYLEMEGKLIDAAAVGKICRNLGNANLKIIKNRYISTAGIRNMSLLSMNGQMKVTISAPIRRT